MTEFVEQCPGCKRGVRMDIDMSYISDGEIYSEVDLCERCGAVVVIQVEAKFTSRIGLTEFKK